MTNGEKTTAIGGLLAAFFASLCCIGPLLFAALGVGIGATGFLASTAAMLKSLLPYRPVFIGLAALLLGLSLYLAYRKPKAVGAACQACAPAAASHRARLVLWIIAGLSVALILAPYWLDWMTGT
ncbi:MAG: mercuric transporter [Nitrospiraceae bacterium]|nr:MAG: mercuric transporter [Nitrospiraceae bacterium]